MSEMQEGMDVEGPCDDFAMVLYKSIMEDPSFSLPEKLLLCYVRGFDAARKPCFANSKTVGQRFGMADCHVRKVRAGLVKKGKLFRTEELYRGRLLATFSTYDPVKSPCTTDTVGVKSPCTMYTPLSEVPCTMYTPPTPLPCTTDTGTVYQIHGGRVLDTRGPCTTDTHNMNNNINTNKNYNMNMPDRAREADPADPADPARAARVESLGEEEGKEALPPQPISTWKPGQSGTYKARDAAGGVHLVTIWYEDGVMRRQSKQVSKGTHASAPTGGKKFYPPKPAVPEKPRPGADEGWNLEPEGAEKASGSPVVKSYGAGSWYDKD